MHPRCVAGATIVDSRILTLSLHEQISALLDVPFARDDRVPAGWYAVTVQEREDNKLLVHNEEWALTRRRRREKQTRRTATLERSTEIEQKRSRQSFEAEFFFI